MAKCVLEQLGLGYMETRVRNNDMAFEALKEDGHSNAEIDGMLQSIDED